MLVILICPGNSYNRICEVETDVYILTKFFRG